MLIGKKNNCRSSEEMSFDYVKGKIGFSKHTTSDKTPAEPDQE